MNVQVVVEPEAGNGYVARVGSPYNYDARGATEDEAVANLKRRVAAAKVITLDLPADANPWEAVIGSAKDIDPEVWQMYLDGIEEYRKQVDADTDRP